MPDTASTRAEEIALFLAASPASGWACTAMAGDASARRFFRLTSPGGESLILMDEGPAGGENIARFVHITDHLRKAGLAAPEVVAVDPAARFLMVEDLGPDHVAAWLARHPGEEEALYAAAVDVLIRLHGIAPPEGLVRLTPDHGTAMLAPFFEHFLPDHDPGWRRAVEGAMHDTLTTHAPEAHTLSLRDFHAENLIWRPWLSARDRIGLIDYQDAMETPAEYDLASLLRDARRDLAPGLVGRMIARFATGTGRPLAQVEAAVATLAVQRNLRILGIFTRLAATGKPRYLALIPRVLAMLRADLAHPATAALTPLLLPALGAAP